MRRDVFQAIADPVRREIIDLLSVEIRTVNAIAEKFEVSRPAVSKHLRILKECGIIVINKKGRERFCQIQPGKLIPAFLWMEQYRALWSARLDSFENHMKKLQTTNDNNQFIRRKSLVGMNGISRKKSFSK